MVSLFKKKPEKDAAPAPKKEQEPHIVCRNCFVDSSVSAIIQAGNRCPSCGKEIDVDTAQKGVL
jgi:rRNA maturation endonuclease Nob1